MKQLILDNAIITSTSRQESKYKSKVQSQTAYITLLDAKEFKKAEDFGMTVYTSKDGSKFLIVKCAKNVSIWNNETSTLIDAQITADGFKTKGYESEDGKDNLSAFEKGNLEPGSVCILYATSEDGNDFYRLTDYKGEVEKITRQNPFA